MSHSGLQQSLLTHMLCFSRKGYGGCPMFKTHDS